MIERGDWVVSDVARNTFDLEGKVIGTIGAGRIGYRVLQRLVAFDPKELLYYDYAPLPADAANAVSSRKVDDLKVRSSITAEAIFLIIIYLSIILPLL
jgi:formate dehydrogenase